MRIFGIGFAFYFSNMCFNLHYEKYLIFENLNCADKKNDYPCRAPSSESIAWCRSESMSVARTQIVQLSTMSAK